MDKPGALPGTTFARAPIKRARPQLSCTPCRQGKLKCNREQPICDQCSKRARECRYMPPPQNKKTQNMRGRIRNLEDMVVNLLNQKEQEQTYLDSMTVHKDALEAESHQSRPPERGRFRSSCSLQRDGKVQDQSEAWGQDRDEATNVSRGQLRGSLAESPALSTAQRYL